MIEPDVDSGDLVRVIGKVSEYNGRKDIIITSISQFTHNMAYSLNFQILCIIVKETNPNAELFHWLEINNLKKTVYNKPFVLPSSFIEK